MPAPAALQVRFHGAAGQVTGSCFEFQTSQSRFLVDCGMFQGPAGVRARNTGSFRFDPRRIDFVILTHAHLDHSGLLPRLVAQGFAGPIYTTPATRDLLSVLLLDSAYLQKVDAERAARVGRDHEIAYSEQDVQAAMRQVQPVPYDFQFTPGPGITGRLREAGHILGSAIVEFEVAQVSGAARKVVVSGDLGQPDRPILRDPAIIREADVLLLESTYGNRDHKSLASTLDELTAVLNGALATGIVLVPAFAVGRTQEFLYYLNQLTREKRVSDLTVFVDSPMATEVTAITARHLELFNDEARRLAVDARHGAPAAHLKFTQSVQDSIALNRLESGAVIVAASGMCDGGRIRHHLKHRLSNPHTTVLIVGFQAAGTPGRALVDGAKTLRLFGEEIPVHARIATLGGFSAHADQSALLAWLAHFQRAPERLFLVHGEPHASEALAARISTDLGWTAHLPADGECVNL